jgi:RNA polymerase sigma-70 factor (ECF subfamily)
MSFPWHEIRDHLMHSSSTFTFQRSFDAIRQAHAPLADFCDPAALLDRLHRGAGDVDRKNQILTALIRSAQGGGAGSDCAVTVLLLALWPGLDAIRRRSLYRRMGSRDEIAADMLSRTTVAIHCLDLTRVHWIAATILRNVERDMMRAHQRATPREYLISAFAPDNGLADPRVDDGLQADLPKVIGVDALLVIRVAIEGFTQAEAAAGLGIPGEAARKRYQRAIHRLRNAIKQI